MSEICLNHGRIRNAIGRVGVGGTFCIGKGVGWVINVITIKEKKVGNSIVRESRARIPLETFVKHKCHLSSWVNMNIAESTGVSGTACTCALMIFKNGSRRRRQRCRSRCRRPTLICNKYLCKLMSERMTSNILLIFAIELIGFFIYNHNYIAFC